MHHTLTPPIRPFLKWAGNKFRIRTHIQTKLAGKKKLIEPFLGSGAIFLNTNFKNYLLADNNPDLINLYQLLQSQGDNFIDKAEKYFQPKYNKKEQYYRLRERFNQTKDIMEKSILFLYLNRHGYNGLCRYNNAGKFNVPFGSINKPYFPTKEMQAFNQKAQAAEFVCMDFINVMQLAKKGDTVYCDPPYLPLSDSAKFTKYSQNNFNLEQHIVLANNARLLAQRKVNILLSNHDVVLARELYHDANCVSFPVRRFISMRAENRGFADELLISYS